MSLFVLMPLSKIISKENSKKTFWILFGIRVAILLFFDLFITTGIAVVDFIAVFVGAFIIIPIASIKGGKGVLNATPINNNTLNNNEEQENSETNTEPVKDNSPIVLIDPTYLNNESLLLRNIVKGEIESQGENVRELTTSKIKENPLFEFINRGYIDEFNGYEPESRVVTSELPENFPLVDIWTDKNEFKTFANTRTAKEIATYCLQNFGFGFSKSKKAAEMLYLLCKKIFDEQGIDLKQQYEDNWKREKINI